MRPLTDTQRPLLDALLAAGEALSLQEVAKRVGLTAPTVHRSLAAMADAGWVVREGNRKEATYRPGRHAMVQWTGKVPGTVEDKWFHASWSVNDEVDWRFPLVSRIPDARARASVLRFLDEAWRRGMLTPWLQPADMSRTDSVRLNHGSDELFDSLRDRRNPDDIVIFVYGSCARGTANDESDVDLAIIGPHEGIDPGTDGTLLSRIGFEDLGHELTLGTPRALSTFVRSGEQFDGYNDRFRKNLLRDAITVFSTSGHTFAEAWRDGDA